MIWLEKSTEKKNNKLSVAMVVFQTNWAINIVTITTLYFHSINYKEKKSWSKLNNENWILAVSSSITLIEYIATKHEWVRKTGNQQVENVDIN